MVVLWWRFENMVEQGDGVKIARMDAGKDCWSIVMNRRQFERCSVIAEREQGLLGGKEGGLWAINAVGKVEVELAGSP